jgi:FkbM family methyltransferase
MLTERDRADLLRFQGEDSQLFEMIIRDIYGEIVQPGDTCVDGGANLGLHTIPLSRLVGTDGHVFAYEPVPAVADALEALVASRRITNVSVVRRALFHERRRVHFKHVRNAPSRSGIQETVYPFTPDIEEIDVATVRLDDALGEVPRLRFCKLDLEGAEFRALQGAKALLERDAPLIIFERSVEAPGWYGYSLSDFFTFFSDLRYVVLDLFGTPITSADDQYEKRPWYAIAVRKGSPDERFIRERLPRLLGRQLERYRNPVPESASPPTDGRPFVWAAPNPVPANGSAPGTTVVYWDTGDGSVGEVYLTVNYDEERLFFRSQKGARAAPWIHPWSTYEFRLYRETDRSEVVAAVVVTRRMR